MNAKDIFILYQKAKALYEKRGYKIPKYWDKIVARKDWSHFELLATHTEEQLRLIDINKFMMANFNLRRGHFYPAQFMHKNSFINYERFLKQPVKNSNEKQVQRSLIYIVKFIKKKNITIDDYFAKGVYPAFLVHYSQGNLHPWILTYYCLKINNIIEILPSDIIEFNLHKKSNELNDQMNIWWFQLVNNQRCHNLIKEFFNALYKR